MSIDKFSHKGPCRLEFDKADDGPPRIFLPRNRFIYPIESDGSFDLHWTGLTGGSHAHSPLGTMRVEQNCWVNAKARICLTIP